MLRISGLVQTAKDYLVSQKRLITLLEGGLVIVLALLLADLATDILAGVDGSQAEISMTEPYTLSNLDTARSAITSVGPSANVKGMFGQPPVAPIEKTESIEDLEETPLKLTLKGILANSPSGIRLALIARLGGSEEIYRVGDEVEGAEIIRIEPRRVILRRNGRTEALSLEISKLDAETTNTTRRQASFSRNGIRKVSDNERIVSQRTLRQQLNNLPRLLQQAKAVPHQVNGETTGFKLVELQAGSVFEDLGLQKDDVIQSVNGNELRSPDDALIAYRELRTSRSFQVALLRGGRPMTLNLLVQ